MIQVIRIDPNDPNNPTSDDPEDSGNDDKDGTSNSNPPEGPSLYDINKYLHNDVLGGTVTYMEQNNIRNPGELFTDFSRGGPLARNLAFSTYKLGVKGHSFGEFVGDSIDGGQKINEARQKFVELVNYRRAVQAARAQETLQDIDNLNDIRQGLQATHFSPISKLNVGVAAVSAGYSAYETGQNIGKLIDADTSHDRWLAGGDLGQSLGDTLMSGSVIAGATGLGAPIAAGMFIAGAALWTAGTVTKMVINRKEIYKSAKKTWNKVTDTASSLLGKGKSIAKSVSSWFS